ncbi:MAG: dienelactone hydrolase family protein [Nitrososphaerota archaeon]|nr:dienelactone hydrolase family protein [Nitrososphaerota archaeon]
MSTPIKGKMIQIGGEGGLSAYLSRPEQTSEKRAGVIIIHEWVGLVPHIKDVADRYASQGYVALAPDIYRGKVANDPDTAMKLSSSVSTQASAEMIGQALDYLKRSDFTIQNKIGITGFCFGGTHAFNFACVAGNGIAAAVPYYATRLPSDELLSRISIPLLLIYGDEDRAVSKDQARKLESTLKTLGKNAELLLYPGCPHAFFNDQNPQNYRPAAARDAWQKTLAFFRTHLS